MRADNNPMDVELNIAPIIDCFVVLITFLLMSSSMLKVGVIDAGVKGKEGAAQSVASTKSEKLFKVILGKDGSLKYQMGSKTYNSLLGKLSETMGVPGKTTHAVVLEVQTGTEYGLVIRALDELRPYASSLSLGGI